MEYTLENKYDLIRKYVPYGAEFYTKFYTKSANIIKEKRKNRNFLRFFLVFPAGIEPTTAP